MCKAGDGLGLVCEGTGCAAVREYGNLYVLGVGQGVLERQNELGQAALNTASVAWASWSAGDENHMRGRAFYR